MENKEKINQYKEPAGEPSPIRRRFSRWKSDLQRRLTKICSRKSRKRLRQKEEPNSRCGTMTSHSSFRADIRAPRAGGHRRGDFQIVFSVGFHTDIRAGPRNIRTEGADPMSI